MIKEVIIQQQGQNEVVCFPRTAPPKKKTPKQTKLPYNCQPTARSFMSQINKSQFTIDPGKYTGKSHLSKYIQPFPITRPATAMTQVILIAHLGD